MFSSASERARLTWPIGSEEFNISPPRRVAKSRRLEKSTSINTVYAEPLSSSMSTRRRKRALRYIRWYIQQVKTKYSYREYKSAGVSGREHVPWSPQQIDSIINESKGHLAALDVHY